MIGKKRKNKYIYPVTITKKVRITYNESPAHQGYLIHAVDFITPINTPIKAARSGVVVEVKSDSTIGGTTKNYDRFGNFIELKHTNNEYSIYEHLRKNGSLVKVGDKVKTGQLIGYSGDTGWIANLGPHLHFNVHRYIGKSTSQYRSIKILWKNSLK